MTGDFLWFESVGLDIVPQIEHAVRGQIQFGILVKAAILPGHRQNPAVFLGLSAAIPGQIGIKEHGIGLFLRQAQLVVAGSIGEVAHHQQLVPLLIDAGEGHHIRVGTARIDPVEAALVGFVLPERAVPGIDLVELPDAGLHLAMALLFQQIPLQLAVVIPLAHLAEFAAHKAHLLAGEGHHKAKEAAHSCQLFGLQPGELLQQAALSVDKFLIGKGQDMLNIYYGDMEEAVYNTAVYFKNTYEDNWITEPIVRDIIKDVDKSEVIDSNLIESPVLGKISPLALSGGTKTLILIINDKEKIFNASTCGNNCAKWLLKISENEDVTINLRHLMDFGAGRFNIKVLNTEKIVHNMSELLDEAMAYV